MIHGFALALLLENTVGTYSSIYVASALALKLGSPVSTYCLHK